MKELKLNGYSAKIQCEPETRTWVVEATPAMNGVSENAVSKYIEFLCYLRNTLQVLNDLGFKG